MREVAELSGRLCGCITILGGGLVMDLPERFNPFRIFITSLNRRISDFDHQGQRRSGKRKNENKNGIKNEKKEKEMKWD